MRKIREVLRLKQECGLPVRAIARSCGIGHTSVHEYLRRAEDAGLTWAAARQMGDEAVSRLLFPPPRKRIELVEPDWPRVQLELRRKGVTRRLLWLEYRQSVANGFGYSAFCNRLAAWQAAAAPTMRRTYTAGEWCFVDYAGMPARYVEPETGEVREVPVFVAVLAASDYVYVEAQPAADTASWIAGHVHAFADFGGVPAIVSPDNTKTAVKRACRYEPDLNPSYQEMAEHYGVAIVPARVRKPRDKAPGEAAVLVVERWMLAPLRNLTFFGLAALNDGIREQRTRVNERPLRGLGVSRRQLLESIERPALRPLPEQPYEFAVHARATVAPDYHVAFEQNFYSVPYELLHQRLEVRATRTIVEIYRHGLRIAAHARAFGVGRYITNPAHMPPHHRFVAEWSPQRFVRWGKAKGPATAAMVEALLAAKAHPEQAYRACLGLLRLADVHGAERLDNACRRALHFRATSYKAVKNILDAELDRVAVDEGPAAPPRSHELLRGGAYYS